MTVEVSSILEGEEFGRTHALNQWLASSNPLDTACLHGCWPTCTQFVVQAAAVVAQAGGLC